MDEDVQTGVGPLVETEKTIKKWKNGNWKECDPGLCPEIQGTVIRVQEKDVENDLVFNWSKARTGSAIPSCCWSGTIHPESQGWITERDVGSPE